MRVPIVKEAVPFAVPLLAVAAGAALWKPVAAVPALVLLGFTLWFFRDPERAVPDDPHAILSPADGRVIRAADGRVSIFLNIFNVHVCRSPVSARVDALDQVPGRFLAAFKDEASEHNERAIFDLRGQGVRVRLALVAGLVARRIVSWVEAGQHVEAGQRIGLIRFGSRADLDVPEGSEIAVRVGDRVRAGETVLARLAPARSAAAGVDGPLGSFSV